jgi:di/tricarboxylate transporter
MFPAELKAMGNSAAWLQGMGLFWLVVTISYIVLLYLLLRPRKPLELERQAFQEEYDKLGPISRNEVVSLAVLVAAFVMFSTESIHHIPTAGSALAAFFLLAVFGVITVADIGVGVSWDIILFLGAAICLPSISNASGIAKWLATLLDPVISAWAGNPGTFLLLFVLAYLALRFFDVAWGFATAALLAPIMVPLYNKFGIHPIVIATVFAIGGNVFFMAYQQPFAMMADAISKGTAWDNKYLSLGGLAYAVAAILGMLVSIPYWKAIKFIP